MPVIALPDPLARAIAAESDRLPIDDLIHAAQRLSAAYRRKTGDLPVHLSDAERTAYVAMRMPATYAALYVALKQMSHAVDVASVRTCLDVGAGPGTASLATRGLFPSVSKYSQLERDPGWSGIAERLSQSMDIQPSRKVGDLASSLISGHDLVVAAYTLNESSETSLEAAIRALWDATLSVLVVVEPGTPQGFGIVRRVREHCLEMGGHAAAPCTHDAPCPMTSNDWCHRAVRVERVATHRRLKLAALGFEDEKFSYVVMARAKPLLRAPSRIVRRPIRAGGHVHLDLCSEVGLKRTTIGRADRANYRAARDVDWGDVWPVTNVDDVESA